MTAVPTQFCGPCLDKRLLEAVLSARNPERELFARFDVSRGAT